MAELDRFTAILEQLDSGVSLTSSAVDANSFLVRGFHQFDVRRLNEKLHGEDIDYSIRWSSSNSPPGIVFYNRPCEPLPLLEYPNVKNYTECQQDQDTIVKVLRVLYVNTEEEDYKHIHITSRHTDRYIFFHHKQMTELPCNAIGALCTLPAVFQVHASRYGLKIKAYKYHANIGGGGKEKKKKRTLVSDAKKLFSKLYE